VSRDKFEDGMRVVVETAHETRIEFELDAQTLQPTLHASKKSAGSFVEIPIKGGASALMGYRPIL